MKQRLYLALGALLVMVMAALWVWSPWTSREPVYAGKRLSQWVVECRPSLGAPLTLTNGMLRDPKALPFVLGILSKRETALGNKYYAFWSKASPRLQRYLPLPIHNATVRMHAAAVAGNMGPMDGAAIPVLLQALREDGEIEYWETHQGAGFGGPAGNGLSTIRKGDNNGEAALLVALGEKDPKVRRTAADLLFLIDPEAAADAGVNWSVYRATLWVHTADASAKASAAKTLGDSGKGDRVFMPEVIVGVLKEYMSDTNPAVCSEAANSLVKFDSKAAAKTLREERGLFRRLVAEAFGNVGKTDSTTVGALTEALNDDTLLVRTAATNSLLKLDPAAAAKAGVKMPSR